MRWYVVHAYSGMEKAVERNLRERIERSGMQSQVRPHPGSDRGSGRDAQRQEGRDRAPLLPGYVLVEMVMDDESWHLVKNTSKVTGFVGGAKNRRCPISEDEVMKIVNQMQEGIEKPRPRSSGKWARWCA